MTKQKLPYVNMQVLKTQFVTNIYVQIVCRIGEINEHTRVI